MSGCDSKKEGFTVGQKSVKDCDVSLENLDSTEWLYMNTTPDGTRPDPIMGRLKFYTEGGTLKAKYNARSKSSMYDYNCVNAGKELRCKEKAMPADWCRALLAGGGKCDVATLKEIDEDLDAAAAAKGVAEGTKEFNEAKKTKKGKAWKDFMLGNNNLGNKLQARMYVKVNTKKCQLRVTDNYMTIYNGRSLEDSNPNGTNAFVKNDQGELLWENCDGKQSENFVARPEMGFPKNPLKVGHLARYKVGQQAQFTYLGMDGMTVPEGCTFSFDIYVEGKPVARGLTPGSAKVKYKGRMTPVAAWMWDTKFDKASGAQGEIVSMVRYKTCGGAKEKVGVACVAVKAQ
jgi:hypothetical protein